jgi:hypothetical protein
MLNKLIAFWLKEESILLIIPSSRDAEIDLTG